MAVQACVKSVIMDDIDEDDMPLVFKRSKATTKQNSKCPPPQKPTPSFKEEKRLINSAAKPEESEYDSDDSENFKPMRIRIPAGSSKVSSSQKPKVKTEDSDNEIPLSSMFQKSNVGASTRKAHDFDENKPIGSKVQKSGTPAVIAGRRVMMSLEEGVDHVVRGSYTPVEMDGVPEVETLGGNLKEIRGVDTLFEGMNVPDLGVEADRVRREKAERKAKMAELAKKWKSGDRFPVVEESVAKKVRVDQPLLNGTEEQDFNSLVAFGQEAIPQGYLAMNAALAYMVKVVKEKEENLKRLDKEKSDLEARVKVIEAKKTKAEAKALAAEKARIEMATSVQAKVDAEKKNTTEVEAKLAETQAKVIELEAKVKQVASQIKELVAEEAQKLKLEYHAQLKTEVNGFYRDGWSEASQFCRAPADHKVWDVEGFKINLPYPEAAMIPELKPLTPRVESDAEGEEIEGVEGQEEDQ